MNYLIELGRKTFHEFDAIKGYKFSKSKGDEKNKTIGGATLGGATLGAGAGAAGGAGLVKARQNALNKQVDLRKEEVKKRSTGNRYAGPRRKAKYYGRNIKHLGSGDRAIERARMRAKHGKDWWKKDKSSVFAGKNRKILGYGALAGAALGGIAGRLSRGKKED